MAVTRPTSTRPRKSARAEAAFRARLESFGATLVEPLWLGNGTPHRVICREGHECSPRPSQLHQGFGVCGTCARERSREARASQALEAFRARLDQLGATLLDLEWLGSLTSHRVLCKAGHHCTPTPATVAQGHGICKACVGHDPAMAEAKFRAKLRDAGAVLLETAYLGSASPHRIHCARGHNTTATPRHVTGADGVCRVCSGRDADAAWENFSQRVADLGGVVLETHWLSAEVPHRVRCPAGHECSPRPRCVQQGQGLCTVCVGNDSRAAEAKFHARVSELGGELLEARWLGVQTPHRVRCPEGHETTVRPNGVQQGRGLCRYCRGAGWDVFYVVANDLEQRVKFGVSTGSGARRLQNHRAAGYTRMVRLIDGLPPEVAPAMERLVKSTLRIAGEVPVQGCEYFGDHVLATILDIADNYPIELGA